MASSSSSSSFSSSSNPPKYDVFLSFRGEDTRNNFTTYLYDALCRRQLVVFIDNRELRRGDEISLSLSEAIEDSSLSIIILSKNYASSSWCLNELIWILDCKKTKGHIILPIFYHVSPSEVRKQTGAYGDAFAKHEKRFKKTKDNVQKWRAALTEVANLAGWELNQHVGPEYEIIENIAKDILKRLNHISSSDHLTGLVGMVPRIERVEPLLWIGRADVRFIGIWGMGGIGKTTMARVIFNRISNQFEGCCFLANIKNEAKYGSYHLREKLLSKIFEYQNINIDSFVLNRLRHKKILIVLDDIDDSEDLNFLVEDHYLFGPGSRIIITSRDKQVLKSVVDEFYELKKLNYHESLQLFSANAFKQNYPPEDYLELSKQVLNYAKGNPLALKVLGCFLFGRGNLEWKSSLNKLKMSPYLKIQNMLRISYDGLDDQEKEIFLFIACFFKGEAKDRVTTILDGCGLFAEIGLSVLVDKCLITIVENKLLMHDLIQEMGRGIVIQESIKEPSQRSTLWNSQEIYNLFKQNIGTSEVESIHLDLSQISELHLGPDAFTRMHRLKFLKFYSSMYDRGYKEDNKVHLCQGLELLPDELRYLHWHRYQLKSLPSTFNPIHLIELEMHHSNIEHLWKDNTYIESLRRIDLSYSQHLIETPNLSRAWNLQTMILKGCSSFIKFPTTSWNIKELYLSDTAIDEIPSAIECLNKLVSLKLDNCRAIKHIPSSLTQLPRLSQLHMANCKKIERLPKGFCGLKSLSVLNLSGCSGLAKELGRKQLPSSSRLCSVKLLDLSECKLLVLPSGIFNRLFSLESLNLKGNNFESLSLRPLVSLKSLDISYCERLQSLQEFPLPSHLIYLQAHNCILLETLPTTKAVFNYSSQQRFSYSNCLKLDENTCRNLIHDVQLRIQVMATNANETTSLMEDYDLENHKEVPLVILCLPGSEIPSWFNHQNLGSLATIELPPHWCSNRFSGFALCIVAAFEDTCDYKGFSVECKCNFITNDGESHEIVCHLEHLAEGLPKSNHIFLVYDHHLYDHLVERDHNLSIFSSCQKAFFQFSPLDRGLEPLLNCKVKKCGVHLLYSEQEITECRDDFNGHDIERVENGRDHISNEKKDDPNFEANSGLDVDEHYNYSFINLELRQ